MRKNYERVIAFMNRPQVILYECELKGQLSDGYWENSRPNDHWEYMSDATAIIDPSNLGPNFYPKRKYNFAAKDLVEVVGQRMIWWVKFYTFLPNLPLDEHWAYDLSDGLNDIKSMLRYASEGEKYYREKIQKIQLATHNTNLYEVYEDVISQVKYTEKDLKRDLKQMSQIVNTQQRKD